MPSDGDSAYPALLAKIRQLEAEAGRLRQLIAELKELFPNFADFYGAVGIFFRDDRGRLQGKLAVLIQFGCFPSHQQVFHVSILLRRSWRRRLRRR